MFRQSMRCEDERKHAAACVLSPSQELTEDGRGRRGYGIAALLGMICVRFTYRRSYTTTVSNRRRMPCSSAGAFYYVFSPKAAHQQHWGDDSL